MRNPETLLTANISVSEESSRLQMFPSSPSSTEAATYGKFCSRIPLAHDSYLQPRSLHPPHPATPFVITFHYNARVHLPILLDAGIVQQGFMRWRIQAPNLQSSQQVVESVQQIVEIRTSYDGVTQPRHAVQSLQLALYRSLKVYYSTQNSL